jgi:hypothetical protein
MTTVQLNDRTPVTGLRLDANGNLVGIARAARTGIQLYAGYEVGKPDMKVVRVYRPEGEVFNRDAMRSFAAAPVTIDHPPVMVDPTNWKDYAKGETASDDIVRDGEIVKVPFLIRDAEAIRTAQDEKHEVSMGYSCKLEFAAGQTPTGEAYDAIQRDIRINHLAIVDKARGGENLRIGDHEPARKEIKVKTILVDGLQVEVTDQAEAAIVKLQGQIADALGKVSDATTKLSDAEKAKSEADGKIVALEKQLSDATNPAALQAAATERADLIARATRSSRVSPPTARPMTKSARPSWMPSWVPAPRRSTRRVSVARSPRLPPTSRSKPRRRATRWRTPSPATASVTAATTPSSSWPMLARRRLMPVRNISAPASIRPKPRAPNAARFELA